MGIWTVRLEPDPCSVLAWFRSDHEGKVSLYPWRNRVVFALLEKLAAKLAFAIFEWKSIREWEDGLLHKLAFYWIFVLLRLLLGGESEAQVNLLKLADEAWRQPGCGVALSILVFLVSQQTEGSAPVAHRMCKAGTCASLSSPSYQGPYKKILCKASL